MLYLGLGPDDEYEEYDPAEDAPAPKAAPREPAAVATRPAPAPRPRQAAPRPAPSRPAPPSNAPPPPDNEGSSVRPVPSGGGGEAPAPKPRPVVRPVPAAASAKPHVVSPTSFNHAQEVADKFKATQPVILNLQGVERDLARRLIDFSSGLCYGLGGHM